MTKTPRYLITTADERTWKFDRPVVFLGEWCRLYNRKHVWQDMDAIVAPSYGLGQIQKEIGLNEARMLEDRVFQQLCAVLNQHHGTQHGQRFWRIFLGHWLRRFVDTLLNRVKTLEQCLQTYQVSGTTAYASDHYTLATPDSISMIWATNNDRWNNGLTARILTLLGAVNFPIEVIPVDSAVNVLPDHWFKPLPNSQALKRSVLKWGHQQVKKVAKYLVRDKDAFIIGSYLPKIEEIKLELALRQCPQMWSLPKLDVVEKTDRMLRQSLSKQFVTNSSNNLEYVINAMLFELLPVCYLEGFTNLLKLAGEQPWPKSPKFIWTSNAFATNEVFKLWAATKVESGSKYFVGQHGNNYGTSRYMYPSIEEVTADKFLTWGWADGLPQHTPTFVFKTAGRKKGTYDPEGGVLLIETCINHRYTIWDCAREFVDYFNDQMLFVSKLASKSKQQLLIRLREQSQYLRWDEEARWRAFDSTLKFDIGGTDLDCLIASSRLVVHSYDSTGILETLLQNIPTLAFWQNDFDHLRESAKPYYQLLVDAGIVHLTAESAAQKVNEVWDDVDGWWAQSKIQTARKVFCERYARKSGNPIHDLVKILSEKI